MILPPYLSLLFAKLLSLILAGIINMEDGKQE
jgi:hypothetical protein